MINQTLVIIGYKNKDNIFSQVISGQLLLKKVPLVLTIEMEFLTPIIIKYFENVIRIENDDAVILNLLHIYVDNFIFFPNYKENYTEFCEVVHNITFLETFTVIAFTDEQMSLLNSFGIPLIDVPWTGSRTDSRTDSNNELIYIYPDSCDRFISLSIAKSIKIVFSKFSFPADPVTTLTKVYGATPFFKGIPLEQLLITDIAKKGYRLIVCEMYDHVLYNDIIPKVKYPNSLRFNEGLSLRNNGSVVLSFVMSDGDNINFLAGRIIKMMKFKRSRDYPLTWTISADAPEFFYLMIKDNNTCVNDYYINGPGSACDNFTSELQEQYNELRKQQAEKFNFKINNEIESNISSLLFDTNRYTNKTLRYNYFSYSRLLPYADSNSSVSLLYGSLTIMVPKDLEKIMSIDFKPGKYIIPVGINLISMELLDACIIKLIDKGYGIGTFV